MSSYNELTLTFYLFLVRKICLHQILKNLEDSSWVEVVTEAKLPIHVLTNGEYMRIKYTMEIEHPETEEMVEVEIQAEVHYQLDHNTFQQDAEFDVISINCQSLGVFLIMMI
jgi:hypothetical protein